ncbi:contact-dependent growth inhibition system immunity protein [Pedobacter sp. WC2501]|uniref:contact-dependent growth inhibition system immunity protein n=1 Tax=Pedobacter sp. WC2501 TaxID=3461400 RepID=UPI004045B1DE
MFKELIDLLGERKPNKSEGKRASAVLYPNKINFDTYHKIGQKLWDWESSANVTTLQPDADDKDIGQTVRLHLDLTRYNFLFKKHERVLADKHLQKFLAAHGFQTYHELCEDALLVEIWEANEKIILVPTLNGGDSGRQRGFHSLDWKSISCNKEISNEDLGAIVRKAWRRCDE